MEKLNFYIVENDPFNPHHQGLRDNNSPFLACTSVSPNDLVVYTINGEVDYKDKIAWLSTLCERDGETFSLAVLSYEGSPGIGDDQTNSSSLDILKVLWLEKLRDTGDWAYAPCQVVKGDKENAITLKAFVDPREWNSSWQLGDMPSDAIAYAQTQKEEAKALPPLSEEVIEAATRNIFGEDY